MVCENRRLITLLDMMAVTFLAPYKQENDFCFENQAYNESYSFNTVLF